jgi:hypothetical protein
MKSEPRPARKRPHLTRTRGRAASETYSLSKAKAHLGRLVEKSAQGIVIYIEARGRRYSLQPVEQIEPIPVRPLGYFDLDAEDIALDRKFAAVNVAARPDSE